MSEIRAALTIICGMVSALYCSAHAADVSALPGAAVGITSQAPIQAPASQDATARARNTARVLPDTAKSDPIADVIQATPGANESANGDEQPAIISIDAPPATAEPLLKAADSLGDPKRDLWARIRAGFALPEMDNALVRENAQWYSARPEYVARMLERSKRYLYYIVEEVERRGMPTEIALLPMIESAYNPKAYSRSHAAGIWQFIPATGRDYGLKQNWWVDNRRNVVSATNAALDYLQKLHDRFGTWELALAAYNWGEGSVTRAIENNQKKGGDGDYLSLRMPNETKQYVPRLIAVKNLIQHPQDFGADLGVLPNSPYFAQIKLTQHIDVALAAKLADTSLEEFTSLNPHYNRPVIAAQGPTTLLLPVDKAEAFAERLENYTKPLVSWKTIYGKRGERLSSIAGKHHISPSRLQQINSLSLNKRGRLLSNQVLLVPQSGGGQFQNVAYTEVSPMAQNVGAQAPENKIYRVRRGDSLRSIAQRAGVKESQLKTWNHLKSTRLVLNQKLYVSAPSDSGGTKSRATARTAARAALASQAKAQRYTVRRGDTLHSIAQRFDVEIKDLTRWNKLSARKALHPGDKMVVYAKND